MIKDNIIKIMAVFLAILMLLCIALVNYTSNQKKRLKTAENNQYALLSKMVRDSINHTSQISVLTLKAKDFEKYRSWASDEIKELGIKNNRLESVITSVNQLNLNYEAKIKDSVRIIRKNDTIYLDTLKCFDTGNDYMPYFRSWGCIDKDKLQNPGIFAIDTVLYIKHRIPNKFLFIKWGTKDVVLTFKNKNKYINLNFLESIDVK